MLTQLVDYDYYCDSYEGSSIPESSFDIYSKKATTKVNYFTSYRISECLDIIKNTTCEIAELIYSNDKLIEKSEKQIRLNETVGPHTITYSNTSSIQTERILTSKELDRECYKICCKNRLVSRSFN